MKRIVFDARQSGTSTGRYHDKLIENLHALKPEYDITVLAHEHRVEPLRKLAPDFNIVQTDYREFGFGEQIGFMRQISSLKPDLVHFGMIQQPVLLRGSVVTTMHDLTPVRFTSPGMNPLVFKVKQTVFKMVCKTAARKSKAVICGSEWVKQDIVEYTGITPDKVVVTPESADKITDKPEPLTEVKGKQFIMYVGRPTPHKNLTRLIDAFELLQKDHPKLHLVLVGKKDPLYEEHERYVKKRGIKNVFFTGFVSEGQLRWLYENTGCYVFPSLSEGFGLPGLEAMAHGAPVASSDATCLPEIYGEAAAYFSPFDIQQMAVVIDKILTDSTYTNKLRTLGRGHVGLYSWKKMAKQTLSVYKTVLDSVKQ